LVAYERELNTKGPEFTPALSAFSKEPKMKPYFPFTNFDFWGYIASGFALLFVIDQTFHTTFVDRSDWTVAAAGVAIAGAYVIGQIIAGFASAILERRVLKWIGRPRHLLLGSKQPISWFASIYPSYFASLPKEMIERINQRGKTVQLTDDALFIYGLVKSHTDEVATLRIDTFLNLYSLCRNLSLTALVSFFLLAFAAWSQDDWNKLVWAAASGALSAGLFFRYLKFNRHYVAEVYSSIAFGED
jgi:ABC-type amino acid transport system permease subunit